MQHFFTKFDEVLNKNNHKIYDTVDHVDRVSYVDSTRLVERFIAEGHNLNEARAKALRCGLYSGDWKDIDVDESLVVPVYQTDPAILDPVIESAKQSLTSRVSDNAKRDFNATMPKGNSEVTDSSVESKVSNA